MSGPGYSDRMTWLKMADGAYVNSDKGRSIYAAGSGSTWGINIDLDGTGFTLNGSWSTKAGAEEAIRELIDGVDPATYGD